MDKLPLEVTLLVLNHLSLGEKQECAQTCRSWCTYIRSNGLFEKVALHAAVTKEDSTDADSDYYLPMLQFFEDTKYGKSVMDLSINVAVMKLEHFARLPKIFPKITKLQWSGEVPVPYDSNKDKATFETAVREWKHIKSIDDGSINHEITNALLSHTAAATQLEDISLVYPEEDPYECVEFQWDTPLYLAKNARSFTAVNAPYTISLLRYESNAFRQFTTLKLLNLDYRNEGEDDRADDYESEIHINAQSYLSEEEYDRQSREAELNALIPSIQHLEVTVNHATFESHNVGRWLHYFARTFPNLVSFSFGYPDLMHPAKTGGYLASLFFFAGDFGQLKKYSMEFGYLSSATLSQMEEAKIALEDLTVFVDRQSSSQFGYLKDSSQIKSIKKLTIKEREKYTINGVYGLDMFQLMECIPQLEAVEIDTFRGSLLQHNPTVIVSTLNSAPQLKSFTAPALMSRSSNENTVVSQPCELVHLDISYCQFKLTSLGAQNINQTFKSIMDSCPFLETFSTQVNAYKDETSTETNIALVFSFTEQPDMKSIQIKSLYETYFKFIINGKTTYYHQKHGEMRRPVPDVDETKVYIQIEARSAYIIDTSVMSETP